MDGPLGPATLEGLSSDGKLTATVRRKDPTDRGFTGTLVGSIVGDHVEGSMSVSLGQASALATMTRDGNVRTKAALVTSDRLPP